MFDDEEYYRGRDEHGECRHEIHRLEAQRDRYRQALLDTARALEEAADDLDTEGLDASSYLATAAIARRALAEGDDDGR